MKFIKLADSQNLVKILKENIHENKSAWKARFLSPKKYHRGNPTQGYNEGLFLVT